MQNEGMLVICVVTETSLRPNCLDVLILSMERKNQRKISIFHDSSLFLAVTLRLLWCQRICL